MTVIPGIFQKIKAFFSGIVSPRPVPEKEDDPFAFFEEIAWLHESERIRRDALAFFESTPVFQPPSRAAGLAFAGKFSEKHTYVLSDREMTRLNALAGDAPEDTSAGGFYRPASGQDGMVAEDWIRTTESIGSNPSGHMKISSADPLENLYAEKRFSSRNSDLYKAIIRMPLNRRAR